MQIFDILTPLHNYISNKTNDRYGVIFHFEYYTKHYREWEISIHNSS